MQTLYIVNYKVDVRDIVAYFTDLQESRKFVNNLVLSGIHDIFVSKKVMSLYELF